MGSQEGCLPKGFELKKKKCNEEVESTKEALADPHIQQTMRQEKCRSYSPMKFTLYLAKTRSAMGASLSM